MGIYTHHPMQTAINHANAEEEEGLGRLESFYNLVDTDYFSKLNDENINTLLSMVTSDKKEIIISRQKQMGKSLLLAYYMCVMAGWQRTKILLVAPNQLMLQHVVSYVQGLNMIPCVYSNGVFVYENTSVIKLYHTVAGASFLRDKYDILVIDEEQLIPDLVDTAISNGSLRFDKKVSTICEEE